jgi:hypothetical protein
LKFKKRAKLSSLIKLFTFLPIERLYSSDSIVAMETQEIQESIKSLTVTTGPKRMPRGMLDQLAPSIFEATKSGVSLNQIRIHLEREKGLLITVKAMADALRRNNFVAPRSGKNTHNVCYI